MHAIVYNPFANFVSGTNLFAKLSSQIVDAVLIGEPNI